MAQSRASEVFIPNPVHNLMAFESLPLPPGWQVVHLDLIESIYILHKWKAHGGLPTWFWSATELGEPHSTRRTPSASRGYSTQRSEEGEHREGETPFDITLGSGLIRVHLPPSHFRALLSVCCSFYSCVIFYHKGESSNNHSCTVSVCLLSIHLLYKREESFKKRIELIKHYRLPAGIWASFFFFFFVLEY